MGRQSHAKTTAVRSVASNSKLGKDSASLNPSTPISEQDRSSPGSIFEVRRFLSMFFQAAFAKSGTMD